MVESLWKQIIMPMAAINAYPVKGNTTGMVLVKLNLQRVKLKQTITLKEKK